VDDEEIAEGLKIVERQLGEKTVRAGEHELFKARAKDKGQVKLIDIITARLDAGTDSFLATLPVDVQQRHPDLRHRGHVIAIALMCALDAIASYGYRKHYVADFIRAHFYPDYHPHAECKCLFLPRRGSSFCAMGVFPGQWCKGPDGMGCGSPSGESRQGRAFRLISITRREGLSSVRDIRSEHRAKTP